MPLILEPLHLALHSLHRAYQESCTHENASSALKETLRAGVIQNFEVAYELSWKFMKRWLEHNDNADAVNALSRKDLFRTAHEYKLITDPKLWFRFHALRNESSHTYNTSVAKEIYEAVPSFITQAQALLEALEAKND